MMISLSSVYVLPHTLYHKTTVLCTVEAISAAVLEALMPFLNETRSGVKQTVSERSKQSGRQHEQDQG